MTQEQRDELRQKITARIPVLKGEIPRLEELTKPIPPDDAIGRLTRMDAIGARSIHQASLRSVKDELARLEYALTRIDDPEYGFCSECMDPIPVGRLMLMPGVTRCVKCAEAES